MTTQTTCAQCALFERDAIGFGQGIGKCKAYEEYLAKKPGQAGKDRAFKAMGGVAHWPDVPRRCSKFESK